MGANIEFVLEPNRVVAEVQLLDMAFGGQLTATLGHTNLGGFQLGGKFQQFLFGTFLVLPTQVTSHGQILSI